MSHCKGVRHLRHSVFIRSVLTRSAVCARATLMGTQSQFYPYTSSPPIVAATAPAPLLGLRDNDIVLTR
jgi:hypothetical protein